MIFVGCVKNNQVFVPEHFQEMVKLYDAMGYQRLSAFETGDVYRCYLTDTCTIGVIQSVEAYEEPMLIWVTLDEVMVKEVEILYENESEDYGDYVSERWFLDRLLLPVEKPLLLVRYRKEEGNEVIAITGATITSRSVVMAVNRSIEILEAYYYEN